MSDADPSTKRNISREITIMRKLNHPSIIEFVGFSLTNFDGLKNPVIVTNYMSNGSLEDLIDLSRKARAPHEWNDTRKLITIYGIASAMAYLHSHDFIHRDLKPANILLDEFLCPKVSDFGLSKDQSSGSISFSNVKGTPMYIAPEILTSNSPEYTQACDVYSFGIIVYQIFVDESPFKELKSNHKLFNTITKGNRPEINFSPSDAYTKLIESCWAQTPVDRPSFEEILQSLRTDPGFITELVEADDYYDYISYVDNYEATFNKAKRPVRIDEFVTRENKTYHKVKMPNKAKMTNKDKMPEKTIDDDDDDESSIHGPLTEAEKLKIKAEHGDPESCLKYGKACENGLLGVEIDYEKARFYYQKSADGGNTDGMVQLAWMLKEGKGGEENFDLACEYYLRATEGGNTRAMVQYARMYESDRGDNSDLRQAFKYYKMAADNGNPEGMYNCARFYEHGNGINKNFVKAARWYKEAADLGNYKAMRCYAYFLQTGKGGVEINPMLASKYFKKADKLDPKKKSINQKKKNKS